jgi:hypothetical protein
MVVVVTIPPWPRGTETALGRRPSRAGSLFSPARALRPKTVSGRLVSMGRPISNKKILFSVFLLLFGERNALENVCVLILAPKIMK